VSEIWKDIVGYEGKYQISSLGNIRSLRYNGGNHIRNLVPNDNGHGYLSIALCDGEGKRKLFYIHRLVADAFLDNTDNLPQVNHLDHDRKNNSVDNLEWCSVRDNLLYGTTHSRSVETLRATYPSRKAVAQYDSLGNLVEIYGSAREAARKTGLNSSSISRCCNNKMKTTGGYGFAFYSSVMA